MPAPPSINLRRHYSPISQEDADDLVVRIAVLIVDYLKHQEEPSSSRLDDVRLREDGLLAAGQLEDHHSGSVTPNACSQSFGPSWGNAPKRSVKP